MSFLSTGTDLVYDALVIATRSITHALILSVNEPTHATHNEELLAYGGRLLNAKHVIIVGGGPIGVEVVGGVQCCVNERRKDVRVTPVQKGEQLLPFNGGSAGSMTESQLAEWGHLFEWRVQWRRKICEQSCALKVERGGTDGCGRRADVHRSEACLQQFSRRHNGYGCSATSLTRW